MLAKDTIAALSGNQIEPNPVPHSGAAGTGYKAGDFVSVTGGGGINGLLAVQTVNGSGGVTGRLAVIESGVGYSTTNGAATSGGSGTGLQVDIVASNNLLNSAYSDWNFAEPAARLVDLDATYSKLVAGGWIALNMPDRQTSRSPSGFLRLYQIDSITVISRSDFAMSAKISRLETDTDTNLPAYYAATRKTSVLAQSEELTVAEQPLPYPLYGTRSRVGKSAPRPVERQRRCLDRQAPEAQPSWLRACTSPPTTSVRYADLESRRSADDDQSDAASPSLESGRLERLDQRLRTVEGVEDDKAGPEPCRRT